MDSILREILREHRYERYSLRSGCSCKKFGTTLEADETKCFEQWLDHIEEIESKPPKTQGDGLRDAIDAWENMTVQEGELAFSMLKRLPRLVAAHDAALRASVREECADAAMEAFGHNETNLPHSDGCIACAVKQAILALASEKAAPEDVSHRLTWREEIEYSHELHSEGVEQLREALKQARRQAAPKEPR